MLKEATDSLNSFLKLTQNSKTPKIPLKCNKISVINNQNNNRMQVKARVPSEQKARRYYSSQQKPTIESAIYSEKQRNSRQKVAQLKNKIRNADESVQESIRPRSSSFLPPLRNSSSLKPSVNTIQRTSTKSSVSEKLGQINLALNKRLKEFDDDLIGCKTQRKRTRYAIGQRLETEEDCWDDSYQVFGSEGKIFNLKSSYISLEQAPVLNNRFYRRNYPKHNLESLTSQSQTFFSKTAQNLETCKEPAPMIALQAPGGEI